MFCLHICNCTTYVPSILEKHRKGDQICWNCSHGRVRSHLMGARSWAWVLSKSNKCSQPRSHLSSPHLWLVQINAFNHWVLSQLFQEGDLRYVNVTFWKCFLVSPQSEINTLPRLISEAEKLPQRLGNDISLEINSEQGRVEEWFSKLRTWLVPPPPPHPHLSPVPCRISAFMEENKPNSNYVLKSKP